MPRVSVVTALNNKGPYIAETVASVRGQTLRDWELIVVENGSIDNGPATVRALAADDTRIRLTESAKRGPGAARNRGLDEAAGEWILFLDADDLLAPDYLETRLRAAAEQSNAELIAGPWAEFPDGAPARKTVRMPTAFRSDAATVATTAIGSAPWALHAALVRRRLLTNAQRWPESLDAWPSEDAAFWFPLLAGHTIAWAGEAGAFYRIHPGTSRDAPQRVARRTEGLAQIVAHNVAALAIAGTEPTNAQCEELVRVFENAYLTCLKAGERSAAQLARDEATRWLRCCRPSSAGLRLRHLLGVANFNLLRHGRI